MALWFRIHRFKLACEILFRLGIVGLATRVAPIYFLVATSLFVYIAFYEKSLEGWLAVALINAGIAIAFVAVHLLTLTDARPVPVSQSKALPFARYPELWREAKEVSKDCKSAQPDSVRFDALLPDVVFSMTLGDPEQMEGANTLSIPLGAFWLWSVYEFRCHVGQAAFRRRPPRWLTTLVSAQLQDFAGLPLAPRDEKLHALFQQAHFGNLGRIYELMTTMFLYADLEADLCAAKRYGNNVAASMLEKVWFAVESFSSYWTNIVAPAISHGVIPPLVEGFRLWFEAAVEQKAMPNADSATSEPPPSEHPLPVVALLTRLHTLQNLPESTPVEDPRPAVDLVGDRAAFEMETVAMIRAMPEFSNPASMDGENVSVESEISAALVPIQWHEYAETVILPEFRRRVSRNHKVFDGKELDAIPNLVLEEENLANKLTFDIGDLPDTQASTERVREAIAEFLVTVLVSRGWRLHFSVTGGLTLSSSKISGLVAPKTIVDQLATKSLDEGLYRSIFTGS